MLLGAAGIGGVIGAAASAVVAGNHVKAAFDGFGAAFRSYIAGRKDPDSVALNDAFLSLDDAIRAFTQAFARLKRVLRSK